MGTAREERAFAPYGTSLAATLPDQTLCGKQRLALRYTSACDHNFGTFGNEDFQGKLCLRF